MDFLYMIDSLDWFWTVFFKQFLRFVFFWWISHSELFIWKNVWLVDFLVVRKIYKLFLTDIIPFWANRCHWTVRTSWTDGATAVGFIVGLMFADFYHYFVVGFGGDAEDVGGG